MKIELRNVQIYERMSSETTAFTASLYVNNYRVGYAKNTGQGGCTDYGIDDYLDDKAKELLKEAEAYCLTLDPVKVPSSEGEKPFQIPMNLENFIDELLDEAWKDKEKARFKKAMRKHQLNSLLIGDDNSYKRVQWTANGSKKVRTIEELLSTQVGRDSIKMTIKKQKEKMLPTERILNTNIPEELL